MPMRRRTIRDITSTFDAVLEMQLSGVVRTLDQSHGKPVMSDEDTKLALLYLEGTCRYQQQLIEHLVNAVESLQQKQQKRWYHIFKK